MFWLLQKLHDLFVSRKKRYQVVNKLSLKLLPGRGFYSYPGYTEYMYSTAVWNLVRRQIPLASAASCHLGHAPEGIHTG